MSDVEALLAERRGYLARGLANRVAQVDAQLAHYGIAVDASVETASDPDVPENAARKAGRVRKAV